MSFRFNDVISSADCWSFQDGGNSTVGSTFRWAWSQTLAPFYHLHLYISLWYARWYQMH